MPAASGARPRAAQLTLILTRRCQKACPDCPVAPAASDMASGILEKAVSFFAAGRRKAAAVKFFGGEPLLRFDLVKSGIRRLSENGHAGTVEVGTNGVLLDAEKIEYFAGLPGVQLNLNSLVRVSPNFSALPNLVWNLLVPPAAPASALRVLERIIGASRRKTPRVNVLPAYYREWQPSALALLAKTLERIRAEKDAGRILLENESRWGPLPLFNAGITVDTDGQCYHGNLVLAARTRSAARPLRAGGLDSPGCGFPAPAPRAYLAAAKNIFGVKAVAGGLAADKLAEKILLRQEA